MVLRPRWSQRCPWATKHLVRSLTQNASRLLLDVLGVVGMNNPAAFACDFGQHLAIHDGVGPALVWHTALNGDIGGEVGGPGPQRDVSIGSGMAVPSSSSAADVARTTDARTSATTTASALSSRGSADR